MHFLANHFKLLILDLIPTGYNFDASMLHLWLNLPTFLFQPLVQILPCNIVYNVHKEHNYCAKTLFHLHWLVWTPCLMHRCVYLMVHITKLQLQTTFSKPLYIPHSTCIHGDPGRWKSWCLHCLWPVRWQHTADHVKRPEMATYSWPC